MIKDEDINDFLRKISYNICHEVKFFIQNIDRNQITVLLITLLIDLPDFHEEILNSNLFNELIVLQNEFMDNPENYSASINIILREYIYKDVSYIEKFLENESTLYSLKHYLESN